MQSQILLFTTISDDIILSLDQLRDDRVTISVVVGEIGTVVVPTPPRVAIDGSNKGGNSRWQPRGVTTRVVIRGGAPDSTRCSCGVNCGVQPRGVTTVSVLWSAPSSSRYRGANSGFGTLLESLSRCQPSSNHWVKTRVATALSPQQGGIVLGCMRVVRATS